MKTISELSTQTAPETLANFTLNLTAVICGLAVVVFACLATSGLDMSVGFF